MIYSQWYTFVPSNQIHTNMKNVKVFSFFEGGLIPIPGKPNLPIYSRIYAFGSGMSESEYAVISEADHNGAQRIVKMGMHYEGQYFGPFWKIDKYARPISKKYGIGFYYDDISPEFRYSEDEVNKAILAGEATLRAQQEKKDAQAAADAAEIEALPKKYPFLTPNPKDDAKVTKSNMLAFLKHTFPGVKFSVRKEHYNTYNVAWANGPTEKAVKEIIYKFEDHESSACGDFRDPAPTNFTNVFGGFKYVFSDRRISEDITSLSEKLMQEMPDRDIYEIGNILYRIISKTQIPAIYVSAKIERTEVTCGNIEDFYRIIFEGEATPAQAPTEATEGVKVLKYSEKSIVVTGNTYPIKDQLKNAGGKFNKFLSCGPGWIFPKSKETELKNMFNL